MNKRILIAVLSFAIIANVNADPTRAQEAEKVRKHVKFAVLGKRTTQAGKQNDRKDGRKNNAQEDTKAVAWIKDNKGLTIGLTAGAIVATAAIYDLYQGKNSRIRQLFGNKQPTVILAAQ